MKNRRLLVFRSLFILIGLIVIGYSVTSQLNVQRKQIGIKIITKGEVMSVQVCEPSVVFTDQKQQQYEVNITGVNCDTSLFPPKVGDIAVVEYYSGFPQGARILRTYGSGSTHEYDSIVFRYNYLLFSIFGITFIVLAFVPKKIK